MKNKFNIVQIWIEDPKAPDERTLRWMKTIIDKKPESSTYTLISTKNYFKSIKGVEWVNIKRSIKEIKKSDVLIEKMFDKLSAHQKSELLRSYIGSLRYSKNMMYFDCDIELKHWPENLPDTRKSIFVKRSGSTFDNHCFYVNGNTETLRIITNKIAERMNLYLTRCKKISYSCTYKVINAMKGNVVTIDDNFMVHHYRG